ncbi:MAG: hypothetical protein J0L75_14230 [Spirochaetes bacterium]|nr:hypothetical protein [Spirochaetota bacterium]
MNPAHRHGLAFDLAALAGAFLLSTLLWSPLFQFAEPLGNTMTPAPILAWLILAAAVAQFLGTLLKAGPLQARLFPGEKPPRSHFRLLADWKILLLLGGHGFLFPFLLVLAGNSPAAGSLMKPGNFPAPLAWALFLCLFVPTLSACAALVLPFPRGGRLANLLVREWAANLLLVFSAVVVQAWFQEAILLPLARQRLLDGDVATLAHPAT